MYFAAMMLRVSWLLLFGVMLRCSSIAQVDLNAERRAMLTGDARGVINRLENELGRSMTSSDVLEQARIMETLGEQYHRLSDIDEAFQWWDRAFNLRVQHFGERSPEAGVGYAYRARYHSYMAASQSDHKQEALEMADSALERVSARSTGIDPHERCTILREHAYAYKVMNWVHSLGLDPDLVRSRALFHEALQLATAHRDTVWMAQLHHDIGNTYTDLANLVRSDPARLREVVQQARHHYGRSLSLLERTGLLPSEASMMEHFTLGLLYGYAYDQDSLPQIIREFDQALLHLARCGGSVQVTDPVQFVERQPNRAQAVELMHYRGEVLLKLYLTTGQEEYLHQAIRTSDAALPYWDAMLREYRSAAFHKVVGSYGHFLFKNRSVMLAERYWLNKDTKDAVASLLASERHKNIVAQRERMQKGGPSALLMAASSASSPPRAPPGTLIISYHLGWKFLAHVVSEAGLKVVELPELPGELWRGFGRPNKFSVAGFNEGPAAFASRTYSYYQALLAPILEGRREKELIIIPEGHIAHLPFDVLCTSPIGDSWSTLSYLGSTHTVRHASNLEQALGGIRKVHREHAAAAMVSHDTLAALPFASRLVGRLDKWLPELDLQPQVGEQVLNSLLHNTGLLHIATHAHAPDEPDALPYLVLNDGPFTTAELQTIMVQRQLVVLSTCSSGDGPVYIGSRVISMGNAILDAGADAVVHTLWPVDDRATSEVLELMYEGLNDGLPLSRALQQAKIRYLQSHEEDGLAHPFHWSGIVHAGHEMVLAPVADSWPWGYIAAGLCGLLGIVLYKRSSKRSDRSATGASAE
jgi:tetratricopeptide (TPR) repeat protein